MKKAGRDIILSRFVSGNALFDAPLPTQL